jgi:hypothetical protein
MDRMSKEPDKDHDKNEAAVGRPVAVPDRPAIDARPPERAPGHEGTVRSQGPPSLLLTRTDVARMISVSAVTWDRCTRKKLNPAPVRIRNRPFWRRADIEQWVALGCPCRAEFEVMVRSQQEAADQGEARKGPVTGKRG